MLCLFLARPIDQICLPMNKLGGLPWAGLFTRLTDARFHAAIED